VKAEIQDNESRGAGGFQKTVKSDGRILKRPARHNWPESERNTGGREERGRSKPRTKDYEHKLQLMVALNTLSLN
jgi:hypothetical protein